MGLTKFERFWSDGFRWYGEFVGKRPFFFFWTPVVISLLMLPPIFLIEQDTDILMLFTPENSPSRREQQTFRQFARMDAVGIDLDVRKLIEEKALSTSSAEKAQNFWWFNILIVLKNESNLMTYEAWRTMHKVISSVYHNFTCRTSNGRTLTYFPDYCNPATGCVRMDKYFSDIMQILPGGRLANNPNIKMTYPMISIFGKTQNWAELVFGASVNSTTGILESAKSVFVILEFQFEINDTMIRTTTNCMSQLRDYVSSFSGENDLLFFPVDEEIIKQELVKTKHYTLPYLTLTVLFVSAFSMLSSMEMDCILISCTTALLGVCTIGLALITSFGLMFLSGVYFNAMISVTPFITMCVGIDNDFLLLSAWRFTSRNKAASERLGSALAEVCPSLTISSLTDVLCFGVGMLIDTPAVSKFCLFTAITLMLRFVYQLMFFAAVLAYAGEYEKQGAYYDDLVKTKLSRLLFLRRQTFKISPRTNATTNGLYTKHQLFAKKSINAARADMLDMSCDRKQPNMATFDSEITRGFFSGDRSWANKYFQNYWAPFVCLKWCRIITVLLFVSYYAISLYNASQIIVYIRPEKLVVDDSVLLPSLNYGEKYVVSYSVIGHVFVLTPPDFRLERSRDLMFNFLNALENTSYSTGPTTTNVWFREYVGYLSFIDNGVDDYLERFYLELPNFLSNSDWSKYYSDIRFETNMTIDRLRRGEPNLAKFKFRTYFEHADTWQKRVELMLIWRRICDEFSSLNALVFDHTNLNPYYDQWLSLASTHAETAGIALLCMVVMTALLMPKTASVFFISFSFVSVDLGVIGFLRVLDADIDPITVACILITIGFSVYYTARITYFYAQTDERLSSAAKLRLTMNVVGWPIVQGGLSTFIGVLPLVLVRAHIVRLFFQTITLVVCLGILHGLMFMPVMITCLDNSAKRLRRLDRIRQWREYFLY